MLGMAKVNLAARMPPRLPPLYALRAFEAAARHGGFVAAAQELHVTAAAISQQVKALEDQLGVALFDRKARGVAVTEAGLRYGARLTGLFGELAEATQEIYQKKGEVLTIFTSPTFASRWLIPRLAGFHREQPGLQVRVLVESSSEQLASRDLDLLIQYSDGKRPSAIAPLPFPGVVFPVCAPSLPLPADPMTVAALPELPLLRLDDARFPAGFHDFGWRRWLQAAGLPAPPDPSGPSFSFVHMMLLGAAAGQGVALASLALAGDDLVAGRLIRPVETVVPVENRYWMFHTGAERGGALPEKVLLFQDWLMREIGRFVAECRTSKVPPKRRRRA